MGALLNEDRFGVLDMALTPAAVGANTTSEQNFPLPGIQTRDYVDVIPPAGAPAGLVISTARVPANGTVAINFGNLTAGSLTPPSGTYRFQIQRAEKIQAAFQG